MNFIVFYDHFIGTDQSGCWSIELLFFKAILETALSWLWDLQEALGKAYDSICRETFNANAKGSTLLLRYSAAQNQTLGIAPHSKSLTERWASATTRQKHFLNQLREEFGEADDLVKCQLRNAWLELGRTEKTQRKYLYAEPVDKKPRALQAATNKYWQQRLAHGLKSCSIAKEQAVRDFLHNVEDIASLVSN